jgi:peptide/nickel transport system substrate-binding protein
MKKRVWFFLVLAVFSSALWAGGNRERSRSSVQDTFILAIESDPGIDINTISTSGRYDLSLERLLYSPLLDYYGPNDVIWQLAESADISPDNRVVTYHLRKGVVWSDGVPFTADDVIFTFEHIIKTDYANGHDNFVFGGTPLTMVKPDDYTVELHYPVPVVNPLEASSAEHYIMPRHIYGGDASLDNNPKNRTPVGTGAYKLAEYAAGQYIRLTANETYFGGPAKIKNIVFQIVSDLNAAKLALQKGEIHAMSITVADAENLKGDLDIYAYPEDRVGYLAFHLGSSRVKDINLRKAVFFALNRNEMNIGAYVSKDYYEDAVSLLPYANPFFTDNLERYGRDQVKAGEYLAKVSGPVPVIRIAYGANQVAQEVEAMVMQQNLRAIGITAELQAWDSTSLYNKLREGSDEFDIWLGGYIMGIDPSNYATLFTTNGGANYCKWDDPVLDAMWTAGAVEIDPAKRIQIYYDIQRYVADQAVFYPIVSNHRILGVTRNVGGIEDARLIPIYTFQDMSKLFFK